MHGHGIVFRHELEDTGVFTELAESGTEIKDYDFRIENVKTAPGCTSRLRSHRARPCCGESSLGQRADQILAVFGGNMDVAFR